MHDLDYVGYKNQNSDLVVQFVSRNRRSSVSSGRWSTRSCRTLRRRWSLSATSWPRPLSRCTLPSSPSSYPPRPRYTTCLTWGISPGSVIVCYFLFALWRARGPVITSIRSLGVLPFFHVKIPANIESLENGTLTTLTVALFVWVNSRRQGPSSFRPCRLKSIILVLDNHSGIQVSAVGMAWKKWQIVSFFFCLFFFS